MSHEERFAKIENALQTSLEIQAHHAEEIQELRVLHKSMGIAVLSVAESQKAAQEQTDEKLNALIDNGRAWNEKLNAMVEYEQVLDKSLSELAEGQKITDKKLNALIDTVDRIIRNRKGEK